MTEPDRHASDPDRDARFAAIAPDYAAWRPHYPDALFAYLRDRFGLDRTQRLLDLGCGPGRIAIPIAPMVDQVIAVDPVPRMLGCGSRLAARAGVGHRICWREGDATVLDQLGLGPIDLTVITSATHWINAPALLTDLDHRITPGGGITLIFSGRPSEAERPPWQRAADAIRLKWFGPTRSKRVDVEGRHDPRKRYRPLLAASAFARIEEHSWDQTIRRSLDSVVGLQYSYASSAAALLGGDQPAFEVDLRRTLLETCPEETFIERHRTTALIATRP